MARSSWDIWLSSWIIQDGNYSDIHCGQVARFALECFGPLHHVDARVKVVHPANHAHYQMQAEVVYAAEKSPGAGPALLWVVDFGIQAYRMQDAALPALVTVGEFVGGKVRLGIDPYYYMEWHHTWPAIPPLSYTWRIDRISRLDAPWVPTTTPWGAAARARDLSRASYIQVDQTRAWEDESGHAEYLLHCILLDPEATMPA